MSTSLHAMSEPAADVVVVIGVFDGVHRGHQAVIAQARDHAQRHGARVVAVTFDPHPAAVLVPGRAPTLLTTTQTRIALLRAAGADAVHVVPFTIALSEQTPEHFITETVLRLGHVVAIVVGEDFRFGHRAVGDVTTLTDLGREHGFAVHPVTLVGDEELRWSSTRVRSLLVAGQVEAAAEILGRDHCVEGVVGHGDKRGRDLGYPTANLVVAAGTALPQDGVYAGWLRLDPDGPTLQRHPAAISVGTNPQFDGTERRVEAHVLDRDDLDLYGQLVAVDFHRRLRGQLVFASVAELLDRMAEDVAACRNIVGTG